MRIKFNDKIYRLKEVESGVDSLMELVEEYKDGDFLHSDWNGKNITIIYRKRNGNHLYYHVGKSNCGGFSFYKDGYWPDNGDFRLATESEKKELIDALTEVGKRWNEEKKCIEDIPQRKFKAGDKVALKSGCTSKSNLIYRSSFDEYIGKELIVIDYTEIGNVECNNGFRFAEDWLELYVEKQQPKFKAGDKVRIKDGISSETQECVYPYFEGFLDQYIGKVMTVKEYVTTCLGKYIRTDEAKTGDHYFGFAEDWLEPWSDEPKVGDWVIAWDNDAPPVVGVLDKINDKCFKYRYWVGGINWQNIIKFEGTVEQFEKIRKG